MLVQPGNLLNVTNGIIVHQVNCRGVMGSGIAKAIRDMYPQHFYDYYRILRKEVKANRSPMGSACFTQATPTLLVVGLYAQENFGRDSRIVYTNYHALEQALTIVGNKAQELNTVVHIPFGIGCGLANGDWNTVSAIIDKVIPTATVWKLTTEQSDK